MVNTYVFNEKELLDRYMGEKEIVKEVIGIFIDDAEKKIELLSNSIDLKDFEKIKIYSHSIKGQSYNISAKEIGDIAFEIEKATKNYDIDTIKNNLSLLKDAFTRLKEILLKIEI